METFAHPIIGNGRATLAIKVEDGMLSAGVAFCSTKDQFSRKRGRLIASNRLHTKHPEDAALKGFFMKAERNEKMKVAEQAVEMLNIVIANVNVPRWAKRAKVAVLRVRELECHKEESSAECC